MIKKLKKPVVWIPCAMLFVLIAHHVIMVTWFPYSKYGVEYQEVDLNSGRVRYVRYSWYIKQWETLRGNAISECLDKNGGYLGEGEWVLIYQKKSNASWTRASGATDLPVKLISAESILEDEYWRLFASEGAKRRLCENTLKLIKKDDTWQLLEEFLELVSKIDHREHFEEEAMKKHLDMLYYQVLQSAP